MKKFLAFAFLALTSSAALADGWRDNYIGLRIHKNENIAFTYDIHGGSDTTIRRDNFGLGAVVGNKLSEHVVIEFETAYTGAEQRKYGTKYDYDIWANMFNMYLTQELEGAISPYAGIGIGFAGIWGDIKTPANHISDSTFDLSYQAMIGINFALNERIDFNMGLKYQYYGEIEHSKNGTEIAATDVSATEFYFGASYKFDLK
jgi:opacity protein-like surface antigen